MSVGTTERDVGNMTVELVILAPILAIFAVMVLGIGRFESARQEVIGASRSAVEAAALAPSANQAQVAAYDAASLAIQSAGPMCEQMTVVTNVSSFSPGGTVTVALSCRVDLSDLLVPGMPGFSWVHSSQTAPIDPYRAVQ